MFFRFSLVEKYRAVIDRVLKEQTQAQQEIEDAGYETLKQEGGWRSDYFQATDVSLSWGFSKAYGTNEVTHHVVGHMPSVGLVQKGNWEIKVDITDVLPKEYLPSELMKLYSKTRQFTDLSV